MLDRVDRGLGTTVLIEWFARIGVNIKTRKVTAGDIQTDAMALLEDVGGGVEPNGQFDDLTGSEQFFLLDRFAEASAEDSVTDIEVKTARKIGAGRIDVNQLGSEVGIQRVGGSVKFDRQFTCDFEILCERLGLKDNDVIPS